RRQEHPLGDPLLGAALRLVVRYLRLVAMLCAALGCQAGAAQPAAPPESPRVECDEATGCRVDLATYIGWRVFQAQCATCHAADALGSSFAPDLVARVQGMER